MRFFDKSLLAVVLGATLGLTACGDAAVEQKTAVTETVTPQEEVKAEVEAEKVAEPAVVPQAKLPVADPAIPLSQYAVWDSNNIPMYTYYALANKALEKQDYEIIMGNIDDKYTYEGDGFKKADLRKTLQVKVDNTLEKYKANTNRYFKATWSYFSLQNYDFERLAFPQRALRDNTLFGWNGRTAFNLTFSNAEPYLDFKVEEEKLARKIEEQINQGRLFELDIYGFVQGISEENKTLTVQIVSIDLKDFNDRLLIKDINK
jgi:hypothetical protein